MSPTPFFNSSKKWNLLDRKTFADSFSSRKFEEYSLLFDAYHKNDENFE